MDAWGLQVRDRRSLEKKRRCGYLTFRFGPPEGVAIL